MLAHEHDVSFSYDDLHTVRRKTSHRLFLQSCWSVCRVNFPTWTVQWCRRLHKAFSIQRSQLLVKMRPVETVGESSSQYRSDSAAATLSLPSLAIGSGASSRVHRDVVQRIG